FSAGNIALQYARHKKVPLVATFHSKFYDDFKELTRSDVISWIMTHLVVDFFNYADAVWAVNESTKETLLSYGYKGEVDVVPNGADFIVPDDPDTLLAACEAKYDLHPDDLVFLFVGQMIRQKNIAMIIDALKILKNKNLDFKMIFVGEGKSKEEFENMIGDYHLSNRVCFTGMILDRNELKGLYARANLFIFPSVYDNAPVVTREAAALGTPSVIVAGSNAAEGIIDGENGFLCKNASEDLASVILRVAQNRNLLLEAGALAQKTIFRSWEQVVDTFVVPKYIEIIKRYRQK
ncbi:MAG: glycosyltransferase, partial [FCB group bacterium]|nr:glycosyltransferase [FCB group bacterium]